MFHFFFISLGNQIRSVTISIPNRSLQPSFQNKSFFNQSTHFETTNHPQPWKSNMLPSTSRLLTTKIKFPNTQPSLLVCSILDSNNPLANEIDRPKPSKYDQPTTSISTTSINNSKIPFVVFLSLLSST